MPKAKKQAPFWKAECSLIDRFNDDRELLLYFKLRCLADREGRILMDNDTLAARIKWPLSHLVSALAGLMEPDPQSRCQIAGGACVAFIDDERSQAGIWIPAVSRHRKRNADTEKRRQQKAEWMRKNRPSRAKNPEAPQRGPKKLGWTGVDSGGHGVDSGGLPLPGKGGLGWTRVDSGGPKVVCDRDRDIRVKKKSSSHSPTANGNRLPKRNGVVDSEWLARLANDAAYSGIPVAREFGKMANWCKVNHKLPTRSRFVNWLNRIEVIDNGAAVAPDPLEDEGGWEGGYREAALAEFGADAVLPSHFSDLGGDLQRRVMERRKKMRGEKNGR
jgi:hypothetical protein